MAKKKGVKIVAKILAAAFILFALLFGSVYFGLWGKLPSSQELSSLQQNRATQILASQGELLGKFYIYDRQPIPYSNFPKHLIEALVATEDARFFEHHGIDTRSLFRVFFKSILLQDDSSGGGSTITLQLAKNLYGRKDYGALGILINKTQEAIIAKRIENVYSKRQILKLYLNTVPFSDNTYGIESASMKFFGKHTKNLAIEESAVLVGMLKASHSYNPRIFPERSRLRRDVVLTQMKKYGYLTAKQADAAMQRDLKLNYKNYAANNGVAAYFREQVRKDISRILDTLKNTQGQKYNIYRDGLKVYTTLDFKMQQLAEQAMRNHLQKLQKEHEAAYGKNAPWSKTSPIFKAILKFSSVYKKLKEKTLTEKQILDTLSTKKKMQVFAYPNPVSKSLSTIDSLSYYLKFLNSGLLSLNPKNGAVKAWVGGLDYQYFQYDHVSQSRRQVGSTFKPIVYTAALENGMDPCNYFSAEAVSYTIDSKKWTPKNASEEENEDPYLNYNLKYALSHSMNTIAVKVLMKTGIDKVINEAEKMGIQSQLPKVPSIALGTAALSIEELATAYTSFLNAGKPSRPFYITKIEDAKGNILAKFKPEKAQESKAFSEESRQMMLEMMKATVNEGTATRLRTTYGFKNDIAGKTGTTQDNKDAWFVGLLPNLVTVTWVGTDDHRIGFKNTRIGQGANAALPVFANLLKSMNADLNFSQITQDKFSPISQEVKEKMSCDETKRDGFLTRLFTNKNKKKNEDKEDKKGFFGRLFGGK